MLNNQDFLTTFNCTKTDGSNGNCVIVYFLIFVLATSLDEHLLFC